MAGLPLLFRTLKYQLPRQVLGRMAWLLKRGWRHIRQPGLPMGGASDPVSLNLPPPGSTKTLFPERNRFRLLNLERDYSSGVNWGDLDHGALWHYTLNSFDWALSPGGTSLEAVQLMDGFLDSIEDNPAGMDPWPMSRRIQNWICVLNRDEVRPVVRRRLSGAVLAQARILSRNLEFHLMGNHLLENGLALLWAGYWLGNQRFVKRSMGLLSDQLPRQILDDGGHEERSPMYHCRLLDGLLASLYMVRNNPEVYGRSALDSTLTRAVKPMINWVRAISFSNGALPMVNDSAPGEFPSPEMLEARARDLGIQVGRRSLGESGYRRLNNRGMELLADVGPMGPDHNPGHGHCDALSFILFAGGAPLLVDTGTSSYDDPKVRFAERGTRAHNTVMVKGREQSEIWGKFRVGRRPRIKDLDMGEKFLEASHTGYDFLNIRHHRRVELDAGELSIRDRVRSDANISCEANFHFHSGAVLRSTRNSVTWAGGRMLWSGGTASIERGWISGGFNKRVPAPVVRIGFSSRSGLVTRIQVKT